MYKKLIMALASVLCGAGLLAQAPTGGVKGTIVSRTDDSAVENATLTVYQGAVELAKTVSDEAGNFQIAGLENGLYNMTVIASDYLETTINFAVADGYIKNMFKIRISRIKDEASDELFEEFDMDDSGYSDNPTVLFGQNDVFNNIAGYNFSAVRFRVRGYASESQDVYLAGVKMNDAITGYSPYSLWSGLNEATRTKTTVNGAEVSDYGFGGYNGLTNIPANSSNVRKGLRGSVLTNSALYRLRLMMTYASGPLDNGWSYAVNVSARLGGNDWIKGVFYRSFAYYAAAEKKFDDAHKLGFVFMGTPGSRGAQNASTQEVYDLLGDNMYNSNWGYQNGKIRNSRVRITHEPIAIVRYDFTPSQDFSLGATLLYRFGKNGYTALDWYDAADPRPDYYRNLPSYYWNDNEDYNRLNKSKALWATDAWEMNMDNIAHINWDRMYTVNQLNVVDGEKRSKYVLEERRTDQRDLNFVLNTKWRAAKWFTLTGGFEGKVNRTEYYKVLNDLLGGDYYVDVDSFAERDFSSSPTMTQNNLDYFLLNGSAPKVYKGDKYGYDYYAQIRNFSSWLATKFSVGGFEATFAGRVGYKAMWREGLVRKGLFPGLDSNGGVISYNGQVLTTYDSDGNPVTSYGKSKVEDFVTYAGKVNLQYVIRGGHRFYANAAYFKDAPNFNQIFVSPRTRNTIVPETSKIKTVTGDVNYQYSNAGWNFRVTGYYTEISDQTKVMSFYDDAQNTFTNFAMSGINQRNMGVEMGFKVPTPISSLALQGVVSWGDYIYTSNPKMYQTYDNNASIVEETWGVTIPYWKSHPGLDGKTKKHYVAGSPQFAASVGLNWNYKYWFVDADVDYFDKAYLDMNPLYRTDMATAGGDKIATLEEVNYMASQEKFDAVYLVNLSIGKSWYIHYKYQLGFSLNIKNLLNKKDVKTGGYEQTRLVDNTVNKDRYYRFDSKYFYNSGINYMLNVYFRF